MIAELNSKCSKEFLIFRLLIGLSLILLACLAVSPKAHAANPQIYPSDNAGHYAISAKSGTWTPPKNSAGEFTNGGQYNCTHPAIYPPDATHPAQDEGACSTGLDATKTRYKLFRDSNSGNTTLRIQDGCKDVGEYKGVEGGIPYNKPDHPNKGSRKIDVTVYPATTDGHIPADYASATDNYPGNLATNCDGNTLLVNVPGSAFNLSQKNRYGKNKFGKDVYTAQVVIYKHNNQEGQQMFRLSYPVAGGEVHADEDGQFALSSNQPPQSGPAGYSDYEFTFQPDCRHDESKKVYLNLGDSDFNDAGINPGFPKVTLTAPNQPTITVYPESDQGNERLPLGYLKQNTNYTLTVHDIRNNNGLRFQLPYSEYTGERSCECVINCVNPNPPNCERYSDVLHRNSRYKFRLYNIDHGASSSAYLTAPATLSSTRVFSSDFANKTSGYIKSLPDGVNPDNTDKSYGPESYPSPTGRDWVVVVERSEHIESGPNNGKYQWTSSVHREGVNCYSAACTINLVANPAIGTSNGVEAGQTVTLLLSIWSTGQAGLPFTVASGGGLSVTRTGTFQGPSYTHHLGYLVTGGPAKSFTTTVTAPANINSYALSAYPQYFNGDYNHFRLGPNCNGPNMDVYKQFDISAQATLNIDPEDPAAAGVSYSTSGTKHNPSEVNINTTARSRLERRPVGGAWQVVNGQHSIGHTYGANVGDSFPAYHPPDVSAGDNYCAYIVISPGRGWVGPGGSIAPGGRQDVSAQDCDTVHNSPYVHMFGADVSAGGGFGLSCQKTAKGVIYAYNEAPNGAANSANKAGSGVQFGAHAMSIISGMGTANLRTSAPTGIRGLSFANTDNINDSRPSPVVGGYLGNGSTSNFCVPDYFNDKPSTLTSVAGNTAQAGAGDAQQWYKPASGTLNLSGGTIANGVNQAIFVEGNVNITGDIKYSTAARGSIKDIPSFYLIVKNGNIRIDPSVKQLDGVYVAQPDTSSAANTNKTGIINTCWVANNINNIYNDCKNQLVVNGAFVANRVMLARAYSSLRFSQSSEHNMGGYNSGSRTNCGNAGKDVPVGAPYNGDCASEIFNYSPEVYMSQPALNVRFGAPSGKFDAITSLSPVL